MTQPETDGRNEEHLEGIVIRSTGSWYDVRCDDRTIPSKVRGKFRLQGLDTTSPVAVGDEVRVRLVEDGTGLITDIHERRNRLVRRAAGRRIGREHVIVSNVDMVWAVQSVDLPRPNPGFIDRVLLVAGRNDLPAGVLINKMDLVTEDTLPEAIVDLYRGLGYPVLLTSAETGQGIGQLFDETADRTTVLVGPSGTGKSTLLNAIDPSLDIRTGAVSERTRKGKHTTTSVTLYPLTNRGYVVDTPGVREFGVLDFEPLDLAHFFVEFVPFIHACRFPNCTHDHEPGCAVVEAVNRGDISETRYRSYLNILDSLHMGDQDIGR